MGYTLNEIAYELLDLYRAKIVKTDDVDLREIKRWIRLQRSLWLRNEYNKTRDIDDSVEQDLGAVAMKYVDSAFKLSGNGSTATNILLSQNPIPKVVELSDRPCFTRVAPISRAGYNLLPFVPITRFSFLGTGRFTSNSIFAFQYNSYIGVYCRGTNTLLADIYTNGLNITGVFEDVIEAARYPELGDTVGLTNGFSTSKPYFDDDSVWPIHEWMIQYMKDTITKSEMGIAQQITTGTKTGQIPT